MTYRIDLSFDMRKTKNVTEMKQKIKNISLKNNSEMCFFDYEIMGHGRTINRSHTVITVYFEEQKNIDLIFFNTFFFYETSAKN